MRKGTNLEKDIIYDEVSWRHWARAQEKAQGWRKLGVGGKDQAKALRLGKILSEKHIKTGPSNYPLPYPIPAFLSSASLAINLENHQDMKTL